MTPADVAAGAARSKRQVLEADVARRIQGIQTAFLDRQNGSANAAATADLAVLRTCDPLDPAGKPSAWHVTMSDTPPELVGLGDDPSAAERARHLVLVLYATHQQGQSRGVHIPGITFAHAVRRLIRDRDADEMSGPVRSRFDKVLLASTRHGRVEHLRSLVSLLKAEDIGFDYVRLAGDLYRLESPTSAPSVRLAWARQLYEPRSGDDAVPDSGVEPTPPHSTPPRTGDMS